MRTAKVACTIFAGKPLGQLQLGELKKMGN
jgi:hypothetical protein